MIKGHSRCCRSVPFLFKDIWDHMPLAGKEVSTCLLSTFPLSFRAQYPVILSGSEESGAENRSRGLCGASDPSLRLRLRSG